MKTIGFFGGTFDPVHQGHIHMALEAKAHLDLDEVRLVPCHNPPHRGQPQLSSRQRLQLLHLAIEGVDGLFVDERELRRDGPSWTVDTLRECRLEWGHEVSIVLLMGADAYAGLCQWHQWQCLPMLAHIAVLRRPGYSLPKSGILADWITNSDKQVIHSQPAGMVVVLEQAPMDISATQLRQQLAEGLVPEGLAPKVRDYIITHHLYRSTER